MLRIAVQSKGRLYEDTMNLLAEADIKFNSSKRTLLVQSRNFPLEVLYLRDDDIPQSVALGVADIGIVGENEFVERHEHARIVSRLGFSRCRLSLAIPKPSTTTDSHGSTARKSQLPTLTFLAISCKRTTSMPRFTRLVVA